TWRAGRRACGPRTRPGSDAVRGFLEAAGRTRVFRGAAGPSEPAAGCGVARSVARLLVRAHRHLVPAVLGGGDAAVGPGDLLRLRPGRHREVQVGRVEGGAAHIG